jgi:hypothetical protein
MKETLPMHMDWAAMASELSGAIKQVRLGSPEVTKAFSAMAQAVEAYDQFKETANG